MLLREVLPVETEVEGFDGERVEQQFWQLERHLKPERLGGEFRGRFVRIDPTAFHQQAAAHVAAAQNTIIDVVVFGAKQPAQRAAASRYEPASCAAKMTKSANTIAQVSRSK